MMRVKATREGLFGALTASGYRIENNVPFVALPSHKALYRCLTVTNPLTGKSCQAVCLDIGPWNTADDAYVLNGARPQAESGTDSIGRPTNKAGIDLSEWVWNHLGMIDNGDVEWSFL